VGARAAPGIGAGGIILIIVLSSLGSRRTSSTSCCDSGMFNIDDGDWPPFLRGETFTFDDQLEQALTPGSTLKITNDRGAINLNVGDGDKIKVMVRKTVHADNQSSADKYNQDTKPQTQSGGANDDRSTRTRESPVTTG